MRYVLFLLLCVTPLHAADWPQFLGLNRDSKSKEINLLQKLPKGGPPVVWKLKAGEGYSAPVIADGKLVLFHRLADRDHVTCVDAKTGKQKWDFSYPTNYRDNLGKGDGPRSTPVIDGEHVYTLSADGRLHCITMKDGNKVWMSNLNRDYQVPDSFFGVGTSPIVEGDLVVVNVGGKKGGIVALNKKTGKEVWTATDHQASYASPVATTVDGARHLLFFTRHGLVSLDPKTGKERFSKRWRARINASVNATSPVVANGQVFVSSSYSTGAFVADLKKDDLKVIWSNDEAISCHYSPCAYHDGHLYGFDGRQEEGARLRCVDWKTGKVRWNKERIGCGSLIIADGQLIVFNEAGELILAELTPKGYREKSRADVLEGVCRAHVALANGYLYVRNADTLTCLDMTKK